MVRLSYWMLVGLAIFAYSISDRQVSAETPSETECRPYIEKALHEMKSGDPTDGLVEDDNDDDDDDGGGTNSKEVDSPDTGPNHNDDDDDDSDENNNDKNDDADDDSNEKEGNTDEPLADDDSNESSKEQGEQQIDDDQSKETTDNDSKEDEDNDDDDSKESVSNPAVDQEGDDDSKENADDSNEKADDDSDENNTKEDDDSKEAVEERVEQESNSDQNAPREKRDVEDDSNENDNKSDDPNDDDDSKEDPKEDDDSKEVAGDDNDSKEDTKDDDDSKEDTADDDSKEDGKDDDDSKEEVKAEDNDDSKEDGKDNNDSKDDDDSKEDTKAEDDSKEDTNDDDDSKEDEKDDDSKEDSKEDDTDDDSNEGNKSSESFPEDDLLMEFQIPTNLRDRSHISELLHLDNESEQRELAINRQADIILRDLKRIYESAIKPLETLYKYRDLSNRHFGDPEIFSKPLVLFMGPWSGGKSTILNYLTDNEYTDNSLRTGAEPSPAYFNILMHGDKPEVLDGTQLAADWTFSGLQKFGQGLEDRLRGLKLPNKLLEKVNIVEIPGILEVRKQVSRLFPFNDACQWFIDRADIIFLVYDPSKLDVGPETEAILDQLKGREYQTRILLNKADQVKPEELMRVQSALIWNISPLMSSAQPPVMYTTSLWSHPYDSGAPVRLLQAQERAFLRDLRGAIDKRIDNKIASARRFAVRVRNHAKMVDCYLTTYYNHKTLFGNKKQIADQIIENPQNYHIYEGLSTLTNISRYDLPDPDVYRDFFRLNPLYDFKKLQETCTYFRGCPINKLDVAIAYDLPELVGKYKKLAEAAIGGLLDAEEKVGKEGGKR